MGEQESTALVVSRLKKITVLTITITVQTITITVLTKTIIVHKITKRITITVNICGQVTSVTALVISGLVINSLYLIFISF